MERKDIEKELAIAKKSYEKHERSILNLIEYKDRTRAERILVHAMNMYRLSNEIKCLERQLARDKED